MVSRFAPPAIPVEHHPPFVAVHEHAEKDQDWLDQNQTVATLVRLALQDAFTATPWTHAIILRVRREDFQAMAHAVNLWCGPTLALRVYVTIGAVEAGKRIMRGPGAKHRSRVLPWGDPPSTEPIAEADRRAEHRTMKQRGSVAEQWADYERGVIAPDAPAEQRTECRRAFYAGVVALMMLLRTGLDDGDELTPGDEAFSRSLQEETEAFAKAVVEGRA